MHFEQLVAVLNSKSLPAYNLSPDELARQSLSLAVGPVLDKLFQGTTTP